MVTLASSSHEWSPHSPKSTWNPKNKSGIIAHYLWLMAATSWFVCMFCQFFKCFSIMWNLPGTLWSSGGIRASVKTTPPPNTCLPSGRRPRNMLGSLAVCVCGRGWRGWGGSLTLGCGCQDEEELYELTRHQIALCFHLCPGVCVSVVSPDFWKNNAGYL